MLRTEGGAQGRVEGNGVTRTDSGPSRVESNPEDAQDADLLLNAEEGLDSPKGRPARRTSTREVF
jgi:hypothetical protein